MFELAYMKRISIILGILLVTACVVAAIFYFKAGPIAEPKPIDLSGKGSQVISIPNIENGLAIFKVAHSGQHNFTITIHKSKVEDSSDRDLRTDCDVGERNNCEDFLLANADRYEFDMLLAEIGAYNGTITDKIGTKGNYFLYVKADGDWTVRIEQPRNISALTLPQTFTGRGSDITPFIRLKKGKARFDIDLTSRPNAGSFVRPSVRLMDKNGQLVELMGATMDPDPMEVAIDKTGIYILAVEGRDINNVIAWSISISYLTPFK